jgi:dihydroorotate dehydrogenase (fumarate)
MDLTTRYLGLDLKNPLVASASPLTGDPATIRRLEDAGAAAVVLPSLFQEEIEAEEERFDRLTGAGEYSWPESSGHFPALAEYDHGPRHYLDLIAAARAAVDIPIIASLNGITNEGWIHYARLIQEAGASALELNVYFIPVDLAETGTAVEHRYRDIVAAVRASVSIPIAVKLSPAFSAVGAMATSLRAAGADGLVLFNRFYQPDIDIERLRVITDLRLSDPAEIRMALLWIAVLSGRVPFSLAASTGVDGPEEVVKYLLAGADVVMTTSSLLRRGPEHMRTLVSGLERWMASRGFSSLAAVRGIMNQRAMAHSRTYERANYIRILKGYQPVP